MNTVNKLIATDLVLFDKMFRQILQSKVALLDKIMQYIIQTKGKRLRPQFTILCAKLKSNATEVTYRAAALVELLHTATLVHDDVVDEAQKRRNFWSLNALWKNKIAVLSGDYLLSKGLLTALENNDYTTLQILSTAVKSMSEGELLQLEKARRLDITEEIYFDIIYAKTASLIASACAAGAATTFENKDDITKIETFGKYVGMAFQLKDDLIDFNIDGNNTGKPNTNDIKERKLTLPIIFTLNNCSSSEKKQIIYFIKNKPTNPQAIKYIIATIQQYKGFEYTQQKIDEFKQKALELLHTFTASEARDALEHLVNYITKRKY